MPRDVAQEAVVPAAPARWQPTPFVALAIALHAPLAAAAWFWSAHWPWWLAALAALHALVTVCGLLPRCGWLGTNWTRLPAAARARGEIAITIDDGPDAQVTPQVLDVLERFGARVTFFCIGRQAAQQPALCRAIVARGHALENHSQTHRHDFSLLGPRRLHAEIAAAQRTLVAVSGGSSGGAGTSTSNGNGNGTTPRFFRAPAGLRNPFLDPVLQRLGLTLASWTRRGFDTRRGDPAAVLAALTRDLAAGDILLLHDGHAARTAEGVPVLLAVLPPLLEAIRARGLVPVTLVEAMRGSASATPAPSGAATTSRPTA